MRVSFLDWRPDLEPFQHDGLTVATNVIHEEEGWRDVRLRSSNAFATTIAASVTSVVVKPIGSQDDNLVAWIQGDQNLHIGVNGVTGTSPTTGYPFSFATAASNAITAFDVTELNGYAFFVVRAEISPIVGSEVAQTFSGYIAI